MGFLRRDITSSLNYDLRRTRDLQPLEPRLLMRGMYKYVADAGWFAECLTRQNWPVVQEQDNAALEAAYARTRHQPGEDMLVTLEGRVALRPKMEGAAAHAGGRAVHGHLAWGNLRSALRHRMKAEYDRLQIVFVKETMNNRTDLGERLGADPASWGTDSPTP